MSALDLALEQVFVAQVRRIDDKLADIVQDHLDQGFALTSVRAMLEDALKVARASSK